MDLQARGSERNFQCKGVLMKIPHPALRTVLIACMVFFAINISASPPKKTISNKRGPAMENLYPVKHANTLRNGFTPAKVVAQGTESWRRKRPECEFGPKGYLLLAQKNVFIVGPERITAFSSDGNELWHHTPWPASPVFLQGDILYCQSGKSDEKLDRVDLNSGKVLKTDIALPLTGGKEKNIFFEPHNDEFIACTMLPPTQTLEDGKPVTNPAHYSIYGEPYDVWEFNWIAEELVKVILPVVHISAKQKIFIGTPESITVFCSSPSVREPKPLAHLPYPLPKVTNISADAAGTLYFLGLKERSEMLVACDEAGTIKWEWEHDGVSRSVQPPVSGSDGDVIVYIDSTVYSVKDGKIQWTFHTGLNDVRFLTAAEGCVLIAAGDDLYCVSRGNQVFKFDAGATIIAPPVVDIEGHLYLLTPLDLIKVS
jgi:hypothetical protein